MWLRRCDHCLPAHFPQPHSTGADALFFNTTGEANTAIGNNALQGNTTVSGNTAIGASALISNSTGSNNTAIGDLALEANTTGRGNIALGIDAGFNVTTASNVICIGGEWCERKQQLLHQQYLRCNLFRRNGRLRQFGRQTWDDHLLSSV